MTKLKFTYRGYRVTLAREGRGRWRNYIAGPPAIGGLSTASRTDSVFWSLLEARWAVQALATKKIPG